MPDSLRHIVGGALFFAAMIIGIASASHESIVFAIGITVAFFFAVAGCFIVQPFKDLHEVDEMPSMAAKSWTSYERIVTILVSFVYAFGWMPAIGNITQSFGGGVFVQGRLHIIWLPPFMESIASELNRWHPHPDAALALAVFFCGMFTFSLIWSVGVLLLYRPSQNTQAA